MKVFLLLVAASLSLGSLAPAVANSAFDMPAKVYKRPTNGIVNVRKFASPNSEIVAQVSNGRNVMLIGGTCMNANSGAEVDIMIFKTKSSLYKKLKSPGIFCQVHSNNGIDGWIRGTHLMPAGGFD